ncbi:carboxylesterase/lipase family protein [Microbacterium sp. NPDC057944]|uniref:carboxylesterase/lipase family protein n=1 Tax=Microbacterium sp. NPDC057944 TaxID=3346286 RepID=UPI0036D9478A
MTEDLIADTPAGAFAGFAEDGVHVWRGIRYALAPTGELRWRDPVAASDLVPGSDPFRAEAFGPAAPQLPNPAVPLGPGTVMDEDCLSLNVWAPVDTGSDPLPVMVWIHGGAYTFGASSQPLFDGSSLVGAGGVVLVTINYRLGALGFLDLSGVAPGSFDGNLALKDVLLALRWVQRNIAGFGGDPTRVTVFGESAGGGLVTTLLATPSAEGLFHRAIAQSSPASSVYGASRARTVAEMFLAEVGVPEGDPERLRVLPVDEIVRAGMAVYAAVPGEAPGTLAFAPVVDGVLVPESPITVLHEGRGLAVPLIIGTNHDEASLFRFMKSPLIPITRDRIDRMFADMHAQAPETRMPSPDQVLGAYEGARERALGLGIARDIGFRMPSLWVAEGHSRIAPVWFYRFDHASPFLRLIGLGATHATELPYLWGNLDGGPKDPTFRLGGRKVARRISARMQRRWTAFARGLAPDAEGAAVWEPYDPERRETLAIDRQDRCVADLDAALRAGWGDRVLAFP